MNDTHMGVPLQLSIIRAAMRYAGWQRLNGNTWQNSDSDTWCLRTAYTHGEATLELDKEGITGKHTYEVRKELGMTGSMHSRYYRGSDPLTWCNTKAALPLRKIFDTGLDKQPETE